MISDPQTNFLYLADSLPKKYPGFYQRFEKVLIDSKIDFTLLPNTKDIWAVDYMPIQIEQNHFVRFTYKPSYLEDEADLETISDVDAICKDIGIDTRKTDILLDGGNVIRWKNKVIMSDKVFSENPGYERKQLIKELHELLEIDQLILIPAQPGDFTGHADGMVRFLDEHTILVNDYDLKQDDKFFCSAFEAAIHKTGLESIKIPYSIYENKSNDHANGVYLNYLEMENTVLIPTFGMPSDEVAVKQLETLFKGKNMKTIDCNEIANEGGVLNCISWNILK